MVKSRDIIVLDRRFKSCFAGHVRVERSSSGARWAKVPAWFAAGRYLVWSDIPSSRTIRFVEPSGEVSVFRERSTKQPARAVTHDIREGCLVPKPAK